MEITNKEILALDVDISTNGELMLNVAALGYLEGLVLDATCGPGGFWTEFEPERLIASDLKPSGDLVSDFTNQPYADNTFDTVILDGPYKLSGTPRLAKFDERYGIDEPTRWQDRHALIMTGIEESIRISRKYVLVKCQDQVVSGHIRWQTRIFADFAEEHGANLVDRYLLVGRRIPQPGDRRQVHARQNASSLLVLEKKC